MSVHHPFDSLAELPTEDIRLDCAALHFARDVYPDLNILTYLSRIDALAEEVRDCRPGIAANLRFEAMREVIVERHGYAGNADDYYEPDNSYLNRVLERKLGIPISLCILWIEVGRRLNWPVSGVSFPGRFLVRFDDPDRFVLADPFSDGRPLSLDDCQQLLDEQFEGKMKFAPALLDPVDSRTILVRALNNLRSIYLVHHDWARLEDVLARLAAIDRSDGRHRLELATIRYRRGDVRRARLDLAGAASVLTASDEQPPVVREIRQLRTMLVELN